MEYIFRNGKKLTIEYNGEIRIDEERWVTSKEEPKHHFKINENGDILQGFGGKFKNVADIGQKSLKEFNKIVENAKTNGRMPYKVDKGLNKYSSAQVINQYLGLNDKPQMVTKEEYDKCEGIEIYRGSTKQAIDNLKHGDKTYYGNAHEGPYSALGDGIYFATNKERSNEYDSGAMAQAKIDPQKAKVVDLKELKKIRDAEEEKMMDGEKYDDDVLFGTSGWAGLALALGYNVIKANNYDGGEDYNVLDRSVLIMCEE